MGDWNTVKINGKYTNWHIDPDTGSAITIRTIHSAIHKGNVYSISHLSSSVADDAYTNLYFAVGVQSIHMKGDINVGGNSWIHMYENASCTTLGTTIMPNNYNRASGYALGIDVSLNPTINTTGDLLLSDFIIGGVKNFSIGGSLVMDAEWILNPNTNYMFRIINKSGANQSSGSNFVLYID